jgi:hypothetical protein
VDEVERRSSAIVGSGRVPCPACSKLAKTELSTIRTTPPRWNAEYSEISYTDVDIVRSLTCEVCGLTLESLAEARAAGLTDEIETEHVVSERERYEEYVADMMDYDYQNE